MGNFYSIFSFRFESWKKSRITISCTFKIYIRTFISPEWNLCLLSRDQIFLSSSSSRLHAREQHLSGVPPRYECYLYEETLRSRAKTRSMVAGIILGWRTIARKCSKGRLNSERKWWKQWRKFAPCVTGKIAWISLRLNRRFEAKYLWNENASNASSGRQATRFSRRIVN